MEDDLKILKVEYLSYHLLDHTQILNLSLDDQTIFYKSFKWRWPQMKVTLVAKMTSKHVEYDLRVLRGKSEENSE